MKAKEFIIEGGWGSTLTQETKITPQLVKHMVSVYEVFIANFNRFLQSKKIPLVQAGHPVGSSGYYNRDLIDNPTKEYGDIDIQFIVPRITEMNEGTNEAMYTKLILEFLPKINTVTSKNGVNLIFQIGKDYIQLDLVSIFGDRIHWSEALAPERNIKGVVGMSLYSSLADTLNLSISSRGIQIKLRNGEPVSFRQSKDVTLGIVSKDPYNWAIDILQYFQKIQGGDKARLSKSLQAHPGTNLKDIRISDVAAAIKGIGESFQLNNMYGNKGLTTIGSYDEFMSKIITTYKAKLTSKLTDPKFDKATTPAQLAKAALDKKKIQDGLDLVMGYLV